MNTTFRQSFIRDLKKIKDRKVLERVQQVIVEVEEADDLSAVRNLKKLGGTANFYRIRAADQRIGIAVDGKTVEFIRCLPRRDMYRFFP